jgi:hypothetical protein
MRKSVNDRLLHTAAAAALCTSVATAASAQAPASEKIPNLASINSTRVVIGLIGGMSI